MNQNNAYRNENVINNHNNIIYNNNNNNIENENIPVDIYVKFAYQTTNATYTLPRNLSISGMIQQLQENILRDFGTDALHYELVEAGQNMPQGIPAEEAPALVVSYNTIQQRFNNNDFVAFYIRLYPVTARSSLSTASTVISLDDDLVPCCMVCQETQATLTTYFGCSHHICDACCSGCIQAGIERCAICRHRR